jgi:hypothetical protein
MSQVIFTAKFRDSMYKNMWSYINPDMISDMLKLKTSTIEGVENEKFTKRHINTICYKYEESGAGHYVFVNENKEAFSTYEKELLRRDTDDGVCHGASMIYAAHAFHLIPDNKFVLKDYPKTIKDFKDNYKNILEFYIYLIVSGLWDRALEKFFYNELNWIKIGNKITTKQTQKSLETLQEYIKRFY